MSTVRASAQPVTASAADWRLLQNLGLYRLLLLLTLLVLLRLKAISPFFETLDFRLFHSGLSAYSVVALLLLLPTLRRWPALYLQALMGAAVDTAGVLGLVYASGSTNVGMLLAPAVVGASVFLTARLAMAVAAFATLSAFAEEFIRHGQNLGGAADYTSTGLLGLLLFLTAAAANTVAGRARKSEALAARVGSDFADLTRLNDTIVNTLQTGVVVVDADDQIRAVNETAKSMLRCGEYGIGTALAHWSPELDHALKRFRAGSASPEAPIAPLHPGGLEVIPRLRHLGSADHAPVLLLLDDAARVRDQAQQIKLAALGRLSASIAHEIRNPLSAMTQAGQLLAESAGIVPEQQRLVEIIQRHGARLNRIVQNVLNLSRGAAEPRTFALRGFVERALAAYREAHPDRQPQLVVDAELLATFDPGHLQQVLTNLLDNAWLHGQGPDGKPRVTVRIRPLHLRSAAIEVIDEGPGLPREAEEHLFEPFFTTQSQGTGLGLYLARELCAYNRAKLSHSPRQGGGAIFRITLISPDAVDPNV